MSWKRKGPSKPIELIFKFDKPRKFNKVNIYTANLLHLEIQVFKKAVVYFSIGGEYYVQEPVTYVYMADTILQEPRNVSIRLNGHVGRYVKIELYFSNVWLSISEVSFDSMAAGGNYQAEEAPPSKLITAPSSISTAETTTTVADVQENEAKRHQGTLDIQVKFICTISLLSLIRRGGPDRSLNCRDFDPFLPVPCRLIVF